MIILLINKSFLLLNEYFWFRIIIFTTQFLFSAT